MTIEESFKQYGKPLLYYANKIVDDKEVAKDILQDVFLKAIQSNIEPGKKLLYMMVHNKCCNYLEKSKSHLKYLRSISPDEIIEQEYVESVLFDKVANEIQKLPPQAKNVYLKKYYEGKQNKEIAKELNISVYTVKNLFQKNIQKLKNIFYAAR